MPLRLRLVAAGEERLVPLAPGSSLVGSAPACEVRIEHPSVEPHHAVLVVGELAVEVVDLGSVGGTRVEGRQVRHGPLRLSPPARLIFGAVEAAVEEAVAPPPLRDRLREHERREVRATLATTGGDLAAAARLLGVPMATLARRIAKLGP